jgi:hypothetical protein
MLTPEIVYECTRVYLADLCEPFIEREHMKQLLDIAAYSLGVERPSEIDHLCTYLVLETPKGIGPSTDPVYVLGPKAPTLDDPSIMMGFKDLIQGFGSPRGLEILTSNNPTYARFRGEK